MVLFIWNECCLFAILQSDITDVNQIFKDLGMLVHEQGDVIGVYIATLCNTLY